MSFFEKIVNIFTRKPVPGIIIISEVHAMEAILDEIVEEVMSQENKSLIEVE